MRLKQLWTTVPLPAKLKLFWERVTFSRVTKFYFLFSVLHCLVQLVFQVQAFAINARAADFLWHLVTQADAADPGFAVFNDDELRFCESVPNGISTTSCQLIWAAAGLKDNTSEISETSQAPRPSTSAALTSLATPLVSSSTATVQFVTVSNTAGATPSSPTPQPSTSHNPILVVEDEEEEDEEEVDDDSDAESVVSDDDEDDVESVVSDDEELEKRDHLGFSISAVEVNGTAEVVINGFGFDNEHLSLSRRCLYTLNWPVEKLDNTKREDITFIAFQIWVLGMSVVAILNESIPHIIASLVTHILATAWGGFQINHTRDFRDNFMELTTNGACGINLLPTYWTTRADAEIASLVLNGVALLLSGFLSWKLFKLFGWQTFKRVGASRTINRIYKLVLTLSIAIQLSLFFIVVSIALWLDSLCNGSVGRLSTNPMLFKGLMVAVIVLLIPWLTTGWISVRRELRIPMLLFLVLSVGYLAGWGAMFASPTFRWTFVLWQFFMLMTSASVILTLSTLILGILCRINFGKGLPRYLNAEEPLPDNFEPVVPRGEGDEEKVEFPSGQTTLPTFSAAFASHTPPSQMKFGSPRVGPRFTNPSIEPFESDRSSRGTSESGYQSAYTQGTNDSRYPTTYARDTYVRETVSDGATLFDHQQLNRQMSVGSQRSYASSKSNSSAKTHGSHRSDGSNSINSTSARRNDPFSSRWIIE